MKEALLIIDVQNDYFPGGTNELVRPYEAEKKIRELHNAWTDDVVSVAGTANAVKGADEMFLENGMNDYLCKPIKMAELQTILDKWI